MKDKKILLIATGGTIVCRDRGRGLVPELTPKQLLSYVPSVTRMCQVDTLELYRLDSTDMTPAEWLGVAQAVETHYADYDGFVITHGTDTMAYAAATLSCLIRNSPKPVVLTGAQLPIETRDSDAAGNLVDAFTWVCHPEARGVTLVFAGRVIRGMRARKRHTTEFDAFESVNHPDVATVQGGHIALSAAVINELSEEVIEDEAAPVFDRRLDTRVAFLHLTPGMDPTVLLGMGQTLHALIVEGVGIGGISKALVPALTELAQRGVQLVLSSQVPYGACDFTVYRVGRRIAEACGGRVVTTRDVPVEAAFAATMWALATADQDADFETRFWMAVKGDL